MKKYLITAIALTAFAPKWNLMLKGMTDWASVKQVEPFKNYRTAYGYLASLEYYPDVTQNFRVFLAYIGKKWISPQNADSRTITPTVSNWDSCTASSATECCRRLSCGTTRGSCRSAA